MTIEYRPALRKDWQQFGNIVALSHGDQPDTDQGSIDWWNSFFDEVSTVAAFDGEEMVGTSLSFTRNTTIPGGGQLPAALVTNIAVVTTHRRQGLLTNMLHDLLKSANERGEPISTLWSSESLIYGRFGYGMAGQHYLAKVKSNKAKLVRLPKISGAVKLTNRNRIREIGPEIWKNSALLHPGMPERTSFGWKSYGSPDSVKDESLFFASYEENGKSEGYVAYSTSKTPDEDINIHLKELIATTDAAHAALWQFILSIDLVEEVTDLYMPQDDPLWWMLEDPRHLKRTAYDAIWLRILDVERVLSARTYSAMCDVVIQIEDDFCEWVAGSYRLTVNASGNGTVTRTTSAADVTASAEALATCYFGNAKFSDLARAGLVEEMTPGTLRNLDLAFVSEREPWCPLMY